VLWGTLGQKPNVEEILSSWGRGLGDKDIPLGGYESVPAATKSLTSLLRRKQCLLILDDAWDPNLVRDTFQIEGPFCLLLVTTRKKAVGEAIGAEVVNVEGMTLRESMTLLKNWAGPIPKRSLDVAQSLASEVGFLPLALELIGAQAKKLGWQEYKRRWDEPRPLGVLTRTPDAEGKQDSVRDSIELSAASLRNDRRARFYDLAVFPEKALFPASACGALWGIDDGATLDLLLAFVDDALLEQRTISDRPRFVFHDLIREFVKEQRADIRSSHQSLVNGYSERCAENWSTLRQDGYVHDRIAYHMARAEDISSLRGLLTKPWFDVQAQRTGSVLAAASDLETGIALVRTKSPNDFCDLFRWCYARALLGSTATELPPALLGALVLLDETDRARGYAALVGAPERRASAYLRMSAAAWHRAERDTAVEFLRHAHSAVVAMVDSGNRIGLLSELALSAQTIGEETLVAGAVDELLRDARAGGQNEYWAVQNAYEAARTLAALGRKGEAAALIRTAVDLAALDKDEMRTVALIVGIAAVLRSCGLEEEARAIDVRAEDALESANRSISEGKSVSTYSFDLVSSFIESGELDSALIIADRWVIGSLSGWSYPHALSRVSSALQSVGRRAEANTVATRALDAAKQRLVASEGNSFEFLKGEQTRSLSAVGVALVRCGETASAIDLADRLASPESRVIVLAALAEVLAGSSDSMETARSLVAKCIEPSPSTFSASADEAAALTSLGQGLARLQSETQARKVVEHVQTMLHTLKDDGWKWKNITLEVAKGFALLGDVERARSTIGLSEADASDATSKRDAPSELLVHQLEIAETLAESGRLAEATVLAEEVAKTEGLQDPREATVFVLACTARLFARLKDGKRALEYARRAKPFLQRARRPQDTIRSNEFDEANAAIVTCMAAYVSVDEAVKFVRSAADPEGMPGVLTRAIEMLWDIGGTACALDIARHLVELSASHRDVLAEAYAMAGAHAQAEQEARQILNQVWPLKVNALSTNWRGVRRRRAG
jgi:tetratricopeptide (TPR) repeat protein